MGRPFEFTLILPGLAVGSFPPAGRSVHKAGFDTVIFCAAELQPPEEDYPGIRVRRVLLDDKADPRTRKTIPPTRYEVGQAEQMGLYVADRCAMGRSILVTCAEGRNRSMLVAGIATWHLTGYSGRWVLDHLQTMRPRNPITRGPTFSNEYFRMWVAGKPSMRKRAA